MHIMFVCTGNICRSPMGELLLTRYLDGTTVQVSSAGTRGLPRCQMDPSSARLMTSVIPNKTAEQNIGVQQLAIFAPLPAGARLIIMHGNGIESARLRNGLGMDIYFADPYSS